MQELITISFPVYNVSSSVRRSLVSALSQTYTNIEYLIVDDCGADDSMKIIADVLEDSARRDAVKIVKHPVNKGLGAVRNTSIENASGKYIYFMDSDDVLSVDCIEKLYQTMKETGVDFVASSYAITNDGGFVEKEKSYGQKISLRSNSEILNYYYKEKGAIYIFMWNKLYSLAFINEYNIRCVHPIVEDDLFLFQVLLYSSSCCFIPDITYYYVMNPESITNILMKNDVSLLVSGIYCDIEHYKYKKIKCNAVGQRMAVYMKLNVFTESLFRANAIRLSSAVRLENKQKMLESMFSLPDMAVNWQIWCEMGYKFKIKLCFYKLFRVINLRMKLFFLRLLTKFVWCFS